MNDSLPVKRAGFSCEEDIAILKQIYKHGFKWGKLLIPRLTDAVIRSPESIRSRFKNLCSIMHQDIYLSSNPTMTAWRVKERLRRHYTYLIRNERDMSKDVKARSDKCIPARVFEDDRYGLAISQEQYDRSNLEGEEDESSPSEDTLDSSSDEESAVGAVVVDAARVVESPRKKPVTTARRPLMNPLFRPDDSDTDPVGILPMKRSSFVDVIETPKKTLTTDIEAVQDVQPQKKRTPAMSVRRRKTAIIDLVESEKEEELSVDSDSSLDQPLFKKLATPAITRSKTRNPFNNAASKSSASSLPQALRKTAVRQQTTSFISNFSPRLTRAGRK